MSTLPFTPFGVNLDPFFERIWHEEVPHRRHRRGRKEERELSVVCDIVESPTHYILEFEIPGCKKEVKDPLLLNMEQNINVEVKPPNLRVSGEFKKEDPESYRRSLSERLFGKFERRITLPEDVDLKDIKAEYKDGILFVHVKKKEETKPQKIQVV